MSARSLTIVLSARARTDIEDVVAYSRQHWGDEQAVSYAQTIRAALSTLADHPGLGRRRGDVAPALRSYPVGEHVIY